MDKNDDWAKLMAQTRAELERCNLTQSQVAAAWGLSDKREVQRYLAGGHEARYGLGKRIEKWINRAELAGLKPYSEKQLSQTPARRKSKNDSKDGKEAK